MSNTGGANRIELESQILCSALRQSLAESDVPGILKTCQGLYQLFPDLLPPPAGPTGKEKIDKLESFYDLLAIECDVNPSMTLAAYFKALKRFLRRHPQPKEASDTYFKILNAGFVLRKPRLRLSHDLIVARSKLIDQKIIPRDGALEEIESAGVLSFEPTGKQINIAKGKDLPRIIELMKAAQFTGPAEVQALINQMELYPDIPLEDLVLRAGYVTEPELKSLQLAEYLLTQGKLSMGQFSVAMYDERLTGYQSSYLQDIASENPENSPSHQDSVSIYNEDLAYVQDSAYSQFSKDVTSNYLIKLFKRHSPSVKYIVDIGCGAGYSSSILTDAGFHVTAIEPSSSLIEIAKNNAPKAKFINKSIYDIPILQKCDAVIAIGEPLTYHDKSIDAVQRLHILFEKINQALPIGGLFIFDLIVTGEGTLSKRDRVNRKDWSLELYATEDKKRNTLTRHITTFRKVGKNYRKSYEKHHVKIFQKEEIESLLKATGFSVKTDTAYGTISLPARRLAFIAVRKR